MKILNVIASLAPRDGGPYKTAPELAEALVRRGHTVDIYTTNIDGDHELDVPLERPVERHGVRTVYFPVSFPRFWKFSMPMARALKRDIADYDLVHIYSLYLFHGLVAGHYCRKFGVPYIVQPHGALDPYLRKRHRFRKQLANWLFEDRNVRRADAVLFNTEEERQLARPAIGRQNSLVVPLGLNLEHYQHLPERGGFRAMHPETQGKLLLLYMSRINFKKGLDILIAAFSRLAKTRNDVHLVIAGPDSEGYLTHVRRWCKDAGVLKSVTFAGMLSEQDKRAALVDADLFVLTSYSENFGVAILEALACGAPVLISDRVNIWREVVEGGAGEVVPCQADAIAERLQSLLAHADRLRRMGERGKDLVDKKFRWGSVARLQEQAYESVLAARRKDDARRRPAAIQ